MKIPIMYDTKVTKPPELPPMPRFPNTRKGRVLAKKYVYGVISSILDCERDLDNYGKLEGWVFGGIEECDKRVVLEAVKLIESEMCKKSE
jgi:hypothetical protein